MSLKTLSLSWLLKLAAFSFCSLLMLSQMMFLVQHLKQATPIHQLLGTGLRRPPIPAGLVQPLVALSSHPQEALPTRQPLLASPRLGQLPLAPSHLAQEPRDSTLELQLPQLDTLQVRVYLDSSPPTLGLLDSFPPTLELQVSFLQCQVSSHQVGRPCHTPFLDSFPPHLERHRVRTRMCLTRQVLLGLACTVQGLLVVSPQMEAQDMQEECFPQYPQGPGVQPQGASHPSPAHQEATVLGPWDHTVDPQLRVECWWALCMRCISLNMMGLLWCDGCAIICSKSIGEIRVAFRVEVFLLRSGMLVNIFCGCGLLLFCTPGSGLDVHRMQISKAPLFVFQPPYRPPYFWAHHKMRTALRPSQRPQLTSNQSAEFCTYDTYHMQR